MQTSHFCPGDLSSAKILVIGHDPRLQQSNTLAGNAFFGDYYFQAIPTQRSERAKYKLAEAVYGYVGYLTSYRYPVDQIILTNLCNEALPHAPKGRTVYIPEDKARLGICAIQDILSQSQVKVIFAMSEQVNYWLQKLQFYPAVEEFLSGAEPKAKGVRYELPYYEATRGRAFLSICGKQYFTPDKRSVFPILHIKNWPMRGPIAKAYGKSYETCTNALK